MESMMVAASVSGFAADVEKKWLAELTHEASVVDALKSGRKAVSGAFGMSGRVEQEWLWTLAHKA